MKKTEKISTTKQTYDIQDYYIFKMREQRLNGGEGFNKQIMEALKHHNKWFPTKKLINLVDENNRLKKEIEELKRPK